MPSRKSNDRYFWFGHPKFGHPKFRWFKPKLAKQTHIVFGQALWRCNLAGWTCMCNIDSFSSHFQRFQTMFSFRRCWASGDFELQLASCFRRLLTSDDFELQLASSFINRARLPCGLMLGTDNVKRRYRFRRVTSGAHRHESHEERVWNYASDRSACNGLNQIIWFDARLIGTAIGKLVQWRFAARTLSIEFALDRRLISRLIRRCLSSIRVEWVLFTQWISLAAGQDQYCQIKAVNIFGECYNSQFSSNPSMALTKQARLNRLSWQNSVHNLYRSLLISCSLLISHPVSIPLCQVTNFNLLQL